MTHVPTTMTNVSLCYSTVQSTSSGLTSIVIDWTTDSDWSDGGSSVVGWNVYYTAVYLGWPTVPQITGRAANTKTATIPCSHATHMWVRVSALTNAGEGTVLRSVFPLQGSSVTHVIIWHDSFWIFLLWFPGRALEAKKMSNHNTDSRLECSSTNSSP